MVVLETVNRERCKSTITAGKSAILAGTTIISRPIEVFEKESRRKTYDQSDTSIFISPHYGCDRVLDSRVRKIARRQSRNAIRHSPRAFDSAKQECDQWSHH